MASIATTFVSCGGMTRTSTAIHLFGTTSSPGCANFALKTTANHYEGVCGKEAADFVRKDFYVNDGLKLVASVEQAKSLISSTKSLCQKGGFRLHKFVLNRREVLNSVPPEDRARTDRQSFVVGRPRPSLKTFQRLESHQSYYCNFP